jgi:hypothetical protein
VVELLEPFEDATQIAVGRLRLLRAVSCSPSGNPFGTGMGMEMAGVPKAVQCAFIRASPYGEMLTRRTRRSKDPRHDSASSAASALIVIDENAARLG